MKPDSLVLLLKDIQIPGGKVADITIRDGIVEHCGAGLRADTCINCRGKVVVPAAADIHVHMRGGSQSAKEDWGSGTMSALAGGVTVVVDQPNTLPPLFNRQRYLERLDEAARSSLCHFGINAGVSPEADLEGMWECGALAFGETFAGPSSYGAALSPDVLKQALGTIGRLGGVATIHAETVLDGPDVSLPEHNRLRPESGETEMVRQVQAIGSGRCRLHFCHLSCADSVKAISRATAEVTPHHLYLSHERFDPDSGSGKMNPPLRSEQVRRELWSCWKQIDIIASDHAPHTLSEKKSPFPEVPSGVPGVETMVPLLMADVHLGRISLFDLIEKTALRPRRLLGISPAGFSPGNQAEFAIYGKEPVKIEGDLLHSRSGWTPFEGFDAIFPEMVIMSGEVVYDAGSFQNGKPEWIRGRGYKKRA